MSPRRRTVTERQRIITHRIGGVEVSYTPQSRKWLMQHKARIVEGLREKGIDTRYSVLRDLSSAATQTRTTRGRRGSFVRASNAATGVHRAKAFNGVTKLRDPTYGTLRTLYFVKKIETPEGEMSVFVRDMRDQKALPIKRREAFDADEVSAIGKIRTPEFVFSLELPLREDSVKRRVVSVAKQLENVVSVDRFLASDISPAERRRVVRQVKKVCEALAEKEMLPSLMRAGHFLITTSKPRRLYLTDFGVGFVPVTRNRLVLLEELKTNPLLPKPDWDRIHSNYQEFSNYWNSLQPRVRARIDQRKIERLVRDMQTPPKERKGITNLRNRVNTLIAELFPESKIAKKIRTGKFIS